MLKASQYNFNLKTLTTSEDQRHVFDQLLGEFFDNCYLNNETYPSGSTTFAAVIFHVPPLGTERCLPLLRRALKG